MKVPSVTQIFRPHLSSSLGRQFASFKYLGIRLCVLKVLLSLWIKLARTRSQLPNTYCSSAIPLISFSSDLYLVAGDHQDLDIRTYHFVHSCSGSLPRTKRSSDDCL